MSRGVKDLQDVISVSRLTFRSSDDEVVLSDEEEGRVSRIFGSIHIGESADSADALYTFDSGILKKANAASKAEELARGAALPTGAASEPPAGAALGPPAGAASEPAEPLPNGTGKKKSRNKRMKESKKQENVEPQGDPVVREFLRDFPTMMPLPPLTARPMSSSGESGIYTRPGSGDRNIDDLLMHLDLTILAEWLTVSNENVGKMSMWIHSGENFVHFAHFWLRDFPNVEKYRLYKLEYGIVLDNMQLAFKPGMDSGLIRRSDLRHFLEAVFREYPTHLTTASGDHLFLDHLEVLSSERHGAYKRLLSDVKCETRIRQHAQSVLAIRAYALVSVWSSMIDMYCRLEAAKLSESGCVPPKKNTPPVCLIEVGKTFPYLKRMHQAISLGYLDVVHYLLQSGKVRVHETDENLQSLVHLSVFHNQMCILKYLLFQVRPPPKVNVAASSGNTPLHVAANMGNEDAIAYLAQVPGIDINAKNVICENGTPLHFAAMMGQEAAVARLLEVGADRNCLMNGATPLALAKQFQHQDVVELFEETTDLRGKLGFKPV
ncbi:hypothetical protein CAPTEDRAFT_227685 [Capitella teleta]|uniref:SIPAR domain-containing protein n=1 Tax=Capitella teleta TaxID=283909 RepID=R7UY57_CAPTE|nr:hypothetical protein CAPTEDRAFT_227685 [Capitella teleta]|eukprot:ELU08371.1 hypothetical protein CAPTEDRAFT_227685 [Capitella teleta]